MENSCPIWKLASSTENRDLATECLSTMTIDIDKLLTQNMFGRDTSEDDLILLLEHDKMRQQNGEQQLRLVAVWIDADKDVRLGRFEHLLQYVSLDTIPNDRFVLICDWEHAIIDCRQSR